MALMRIVTLKFSLTSRRHDEILVMCQSEVERLLIPLERIFFSLKKAAQEGPCTLPDISKIIFSLANDIMIQFRKVLFFKNI